MLKDKKKNSTKDFAFHMTPAISVHRTSKMFSHAYSNYWMEKLVVDLLQDVSALNMVLAPWECRISYSLTIGYSFVCRELSTQKVIYGSIVSVIRH